jgi:hypothetical protein
MGGLQVTFCDYGPFPCIHGGTFCFHNHFKRWGFLPAGIVLTILV